MTSYTPEEVLGKTPDLLKSGRRRRFLHGALGNFVAGRVWQGEKINRRKDGTLYHEEMAVTPIREADGEISHFFAIKEDSPGTSNSWRYCIICKKWRRLANWRAGWPMISTIC